MGRPGSESRISWKMPSAARKRGRLKVPASWTITGRRRRPRTTRPVPTGGGSGTGASTKRLPETGRQPQGPRQAKTSMKSWTRPSLYLSSDWLPNWAQSSLSASFGSPMPSSSLPAPSLPGRLRWPKRVRLWFWGSLLRWAGGKSGCLACWWKAIPRTPNRISGRNRAGRRCHQRRARAAQRAIAAASSQGSGRRRPQAGAAIPAIRARVTGTRGRATGRSPRIIPGQVGSRRSAFKFFWLAAEV